jgi:hypothetical protein
MGLVANIWAAGVFGHWGDAYGLLRVLSLEERCLMVALRYNGVVGDFRKVTAPFCRNW